MIVLQNNNKSKMKAVIQTEMELVSNITSIYLYYNFIYYSLASPQTTQTIVSVD